MNKVIIPFDGKHFSKGAFSLACHLNAKSAIMLTGIFLPEVDYAKIFFFPAAFAAPSYIPLAEDFSDEKINSTIELFTRLCQRHQINYRAHRDVKIPSIAELSNQSRFADLMIIGSEVFYTKGSAGPFEYLKAALNKAECPVMIVPEQFNQPSQVIVAYDGTASSAFAIKQFVYLFPEDCKLNTTLVYLGDHSQHIPGAELIEEWGAAHFEKLVVRKITRDEEDSFDDWLAEHWNPILVSGSFNKSGLSELFHKSFVLRTIMQHKMLVFVAHH
jgi:hypothetical protein